MFPKKLGQHRPTLHKLVFVISILGVIHFWWLVKADIFWPMIYAAMVFILLADRVLIFMKTRQVKKAAV
jgi:sulfoxide reductase heme-binding subunit YedZ